MKERTFSYFDEKAHARETLDRIAEMFVDIEEEFWTHEDVKRIASVVADDISLILQEMPEEELGRQGLLINVLTEYQILNAIKESEHYQIAYKKERERSLPDATTRALREERDRVRDKNEEYEYLGIFVVKMVDEDGNEIQEELTSEELDFFLSPIRRAIFEELRDTVDPSLFHVLDKSISSNDRLHRLYGGKILKRAFDYDRNLDSEDPEIKKNHHHALLRLYSLPERSPYLTYQILEIDPDIDPYKGAEVQKEFAFTSLLEFIRQDPPPSVDTCVRYVIEAMKGGAFLVENGLRLTDLTTHNIAINLDKNCGQLYDYDGLFTQDFALQDYMTHMGYLPPERVLGDEEREEWVGEHGWMGPAPLVKGPVTEANMVFEFGITLRNTYELLDNYAYPEIVYQMIDEDPAARPSLAEAIRNLEAEEGLSSY